VLCFKSLHHKNQMPKHPPPPPPLSSVKSLQTTSNKNEMPGIKTKGPPRSLMRWISQKDAAVFLSPPNQNPRKFAKNAHFPHV